MKNPLNRDDFENYLEQEVNQHRMYPSDQIWRNIQQDLHGYKKWPALTVITLFVISALVVGTVLIKPHYQKIASAANNTAQKLSDNLSKQPQENLQEHLSPENITRQTIAGVAENIDLNDDIQTAFSSYNNIDQLIPAGTAADYTADNAVVANTPAEQKAATRKEPTANTEKRPSAVNWMRLMPDDNFALDGQVLLPVPASGKAAGINSSFMFFSLEKSQSAFNGVSLENSFSKANRPAFKFKPKSRKFDFAFYATPSISYRKLVFDESGSNGHTYVSGIPYGANYTVDLNKSIAHKPAIGYEVGAALGYKLNKTLTLRTGFQFNMREYDIEAYKREYTPTDIVAYNNAISGGVDISNQTSASVSGEKTVVLQNRYYEISMPVGIDWRAWSRGKFSLGFATSVQPTYIFDKDPFIITSDYKNYVDGSRLVRNWNINTNVETYLSYTTGKFKWQIGPQLRYQVLSTLTGNYPIKEHLVDYGIKLGFVKSLP